MIPAAIYARYSTEEQDPRSIDDQIRRCTEHAKRANLEVVAEFTDAAVSGAHTVRAELRKMIAVATATRRPPFRAVLVDDLSRLARNIGDFWRMIDDLEAVGVEVIDVQTGMSSSDKNARQMFGFKSLMNDAFLQTIRYQTHRGLEGRFRDGFSPGGSIYGYRTETEPNARDTEHPRKVHVVDEAQAPIVRRIYEEYDRGAGSYKSIADGLNRERIPAPRDGRNGHKIGHGWNHTSVRAILGNAKYVGEWTWNTTEWRRVPGRSGRRSIPRPESEHVKTMHPELAIIDRGTWDRVQARLARAHPVKAGGTRRGRPAGSGASVYLVSGLLKCGTCGGPISVIGQRTKAGVRYASFGCSASRSRGKWICANRQSISERRITGAVRAAVAELLRAPSVATAFVAAFQKRVEERTRAPKPANLERDLKAAQRRVTNATLLLVESPDDRDIRRVRDADKAEVTRLTDAISAAAETSPRAIPAASAVKGAISSFLEVLATAAPGPGREALASVMSPLILTPGAETEKSRLPWEVTGTVSLRGVLANFSSGGALVELPADVLLQLRFAIPLAA